MELTSPFQFLWCTYQQTLQGAGGVVVETKDHLIFSYKSNLGRPQVLMLEDKTQNLGTFVTNVNGSF